MTKADERESEILRYRGRLDKLGQVTRNQLAIISEKWDDEDIVKLEDYITTDMLEEDPLTPNKIKVLLHLMRKNKIFDDEGADKIIAFINQFDYGWKSGAYNIINHCLRSSGSHCKRTSRISTKEDMEDVFLSVWEIFNHKEYGNITLLLFNYCLAALFNSRLGHDHLRIPFYLQIACEKSTALYSLIQEILMVCDVNSGLIEHCTDPFHYYGSCDYQCIHYYPTRFVDEDLKRLAYNRDIPIIIDGYENGSYYHTLLREIVNIPNRRQPLEMRDRFNLFPIFICPAFESSFDNVINMNLTELTVSKDYLDLVRENKRMLASWVYYLVKNVSDSFFPTHEDDPQQEAVKNKKHRFAYKVNRNTNRIKAKYADITPNDAMNVGLLSFFFKAYMEVFKKMITVPFEEAYVYSSKDEKVAVSKAIDELTALSEESLVKLHKAHTPIPLESIVDNTMSADSKGQGQRNAEAVKVGRNILRYYARYRVLIRITKIEVKEDKFIYDVQLTAGTEYEHIFKRSGNIQLLLDYEYFIPVKEGTSIKIVASKKLVYSDTLTKILNSQEFRSIKLKEKGKEIIPYALGHDEKGDAVIVDIKEFPHLLMSGVTRSGKSSALECLLMSIAYKHRTGDVYVLAMGFGKSSLYLFNKLPILLTPTVIEDTEEGRIAILELQSELEHRRFLYRANRSAVDNLPSIVCIIDEFHYLITETDDKDKRIALHNALSILINRGAGFKIHMVFATQEPRKEYTKFGSVSNAQSRIGLMLPDIHESIAAIGKPGAEKLVGKGAMIVKLPGDGLIFKHIQGAYMPENGIKKLLKEIEFNNPNKYQLHSQGTGTPHPQQGTGFTEITVTPTAAVYVYDKILAKAIIWVLSQETAANSDIKNFGVGHPKAKEIMVKLEQFDLITKQDAMKSRLPRTVKSKSLDELLQTPGLMDVLTRNGFSEADIAEALDKRKANSLPSESI